MTRNQSNSIAALAAMIVSGLILFLFHDQFWWAPDEGVYAYVAQRALAGDVLHRDLIDLHGGYGNLINVMAFWLFGEDLLSLRYPLVLFAAVQCVVVYVLLNAQGAFVAFTGAVVVAAFSFVQFPNPSANWHALFWFFVLALVLEKFPHGAMRFVLAGLIVGLCFFTRQLSGVLLALGLIAVLLSEMREEEGLRAPGLAVGGIGLLGLFMYLISKQHVFGLIWAGLPSLLLMLLASMSASLSWRQAGRISALTISGFALAGLPLAILAVSQSAFTSWARDIFVAALAIHGQEFIGQASYGTILQLAWINLADAASPLAVVSSVAWVFLILSVPALGFGSVARLATTRPVTILGVFWAVSALHYQIPVYALFVMPAVFLALLALWPSRVLCCVLLLVSGWSLQFQAAHPLERGLAAIVASQGIVDNVSAELPRVSLRVPAESAMLYREVLKVIEADAHPDEKLMTLPMNPELNFMSGRKTPARFYATQLGLLSKDDLTETIANLDAAAPLFVVHRREDKYLTPLSALLLSSVQERAGQPVSIGPFDIYRYQAQ